MTPRAVTPEEVPARFRGRVAIVDDDPSVRRALERLLRVMGIGAVAHHSGSAFLSSTGLHEVECLLLDVHMPGLSGMDVLDEIAVAVTKLPVVLMTGRYEVDFADRALSAGASGFLRKPFSEDELIEALEAATGQAIMR